LKTNLEGQSCLLSSGAPDSPVHHRTATLHVRCSISFQTKSSRALVLGIGWRTGQSGVPNRPLARPCVARRLHGRPLALAAVGSPDSLVNYSHMPPLKPESGEFTADQPGAPDTVRWCAKPSWSLLHIANSFSNYFLTVSST
jgi:hypothetical protein